MTRPTNENAYRAALYAIIKSNPAGLEIYPDDMPTKPFKIWWRVTEGGGLEFKIEEGVGPSNDHTSNTRRRRDRFESVLPSLEPYRRCWRRSQSQAEPTGWTNRRYNVSQKLSGMRRAIAIWTLRLALLLLRWTERLYPEFQFVLRYSPLLTRGDGENTIKSEPKKPPTTSPSAILLP